jgi:hypothetical protein
MYPASDHQELSSIDGDEESAMPSEESKEASARSIDSGESNKSIQGAELEVPKRKHREGRGGLEPRNREVCTSAVKPAISD